MAGRFRCGKRRGVDLDRRNRWPTPFDNTNWALGRLSNCCGGERGPLGWWTASGQSNGTFDGHESYALLVEYDPGISPVPVPASLRLLALGVGALAAAARRRRR